MGDAVNLKVTATNAYGTSVESEVGGGALVEFVPDAPILLENVPEITLDDRIGLIWQEGLSNGGTQTIDYQVWCDMGYGNWQALASGLTTRSYTATGLYAGTLYSFKVKARNEVGFSAFSNEVQIYASQRPDIPAAPTTTIQDRWSVVINWSPPYDGGAPITSYTVEIRTADANIFEQDLVNCDGSDLTIIAETRCTI